MNMNPKKLGMILNDLFIIETKQCKKGAKVPQVEFVFSIYNGSTSGTFYKKTNIYTINDYITLDYIAEKNNLDDISKRVLQKQIDDKVESIEKQASEIEVERFCI